MKKIDGYSSSVRQAHALRKFNINAEKLKQKVRCNALQVALVLYADLKNAVNKGRKHAPCVHVMEGEVWLETSAALVRHRLFESVEEITVTRNIGKLRELGIITAIERRTGVANGNNMLLKLDMGVVAFIEPQEASMPHPGKPPDAQGKADMEGLSADDVAKLAVRFNRKHAR